jgi:hypothetical protein
VRKGKLALRVSQPELDALIATAASVPAIDPASDRALTALLRYLEGIEDRFEDVTDEKVPNDDAVAD